MELLLHAQGESGYTIVFFTGVESICVEFRILSKDLWFDVTIMTNVELSIFDPRRK